MMFPSILSRCPTYLSLQGLLYINFVGASDQFFDVFCPSCFTTEGPQSFVAIAAGDAHVTQQTTFHAQERFCGPFWISNGLGLCGAIVTVTCNLQQF